MPTISVILPVYNSSEYLLEALESITNQTFTDWEMIAIDDGSTDNSLQILQNYAQKEPRLRIVSRENKGIPKTLNEGIDLAQGEYIARMDADDISLPKRFEKQLEFLQSNQLDICGTQYTSFGDLCKQSNYPLEQNDCYFQLLLSNAFAHPTLLAKKAILSSFKYSDEIKYAQDYDLLCRLAINNIKMANMPDFLLKYRITSSQITNKKYKEQTLFAIQISKTYWSKNTITNSIQFPNGLLNCRINYQIDEIFTAINSLDVLFPKCQTEFQKKFVISKLKFLFYKLTESNLEIKSFLAKIKQEHNLPKPTKILLTLAYCLNHSNLNFKLTDIFPKQILNYIRKIFYR